MESLTLSIAALASLLVIFLRPPCAFAVYVLALLFYPCYLSAQLGTFDITANRIVVAVLLVRCLASPRLTAKFKWSGLDTWVALVTLVAVVIPLISYRVDKTLLLINRSGFLMDKLVVYTVARLCITSRQALITVVKWIAVGFVPLALLGAIEAYTGWQPYLPLMRYCTWMTGEVMTINPRLGFFRAVGSSGHPIMFGAPFVMFLPLIYCLRYERSYWRSLAYVLSGVAAIGALSSMSSGPWMMVLMVVGCLMVEPYGRRLKQFLVLAFVMAVLVEIVSNRPIYHVVVTYANPIGGTGWHRAMLIDLAVENFNEWWLCGYRGVDPGWGPSLGMGWTDITNEYIATGVMYGLLGVIALIGVIVVAIRKLVHLRRSTKDPVLRSWFWALGTVIVMMAVSFNSCALFSQADMVFYCILGIVGSSGNLLLGTLNKRQLAVQTSSV